MVGELRVSFNARPLPCVERQGIPFMHETYISL